MAPRSEETPTSTVASSPPSAKDSSVRPESSWENSIMAKAHTDDWTKVKNEFDGIDPKLWRIGDKLYDFADFVGKHPGGQVWINLTRGTDITEAFEVIHVFGNDNKDKILEKYFVGAAKNPRFERYTFEKDGFYKTLQGRARRVLKEVGTGPTAQMRLLQDGLVLLFHLLLLASIFTESLLVVVSTGLVLGMTMSASHNFVHQKDNFRRFYMDLSINSSAEWRISHVLSHHLFVNTYHDLEITAYYPFFDLLPTETKSWVHRFLSPLYFHVFPLFIPFLNVFRRFSSIFKGTRPFGVENLIPLLQLVALLVFSPSVSAPRILLHWVLIHGLAISWVWELGVTATHHNPSLYHLGDKELDKDWGMQQIDTISDGECDNLFVVATTFKHHTLHHMFPTVDHSKLHHLYPVLEQTCKEFGVKYERPSMWGMYWGFHSQLVRDKPSTLEERLKKKAL